MQRSAFCLRTAILAAAIQFGIGLASAHAQTYRERLLHTFSGPPDGSTPYAGLIRVPLEIYMVRLGEAVPLEPDAAVVAAGRSSSWIGQATKLSFTASLECPTARILMRRC